MNQTTKPHTYVADITQLPKALRHITGQKRWVVWRWELRKRKNGALAWTKPPYQCAHPKDGGEVQCPEHLGYLRRGGGCGGGWAR